MSIYILDFETNGLTFADIEVTEIGLITLDKDLRKIDEYQEYFKVDNLKDSEQFTGITYDMLDEKATRRFDDYLPELVEKLKYGVIIGQNVSYDIIVLDILCLKNGLPIIPKYNLDIIEQYKVNDQYVSLDYTAKERLGEEVINKLKMELQSDFHSALYDVNIVWEIIRRDDYFKNRLITYLSTIPSQEGVD